MSFIKNLKNAFGFSAVAAGSSGFLIVVFHIGGKGIVQYETDIVLIYTHAEGVCRNYKINFP